MTDLVNFGRFLSHNKLFSPWYMEVILLITRKIVRLNLFLNFTESPLLSIVFFTPVISILNFIFLFSTSVILVLRSFCNYISLQNTNSSTCHFSEVNSRTYYFILDWGSSCMNLFLSLSQWYLVFNFQYSLF